MAEETGNNTLEEKVRNNTLAEKARRICQFCCSWDGRDVSEGEFSFFIGKRPLIVRKVRLCLRCEGIFFGNTLRSLSSDESIVAALRAVMPPPKKESVL
jgi:hypothetical protein